MTPTKKSTRIITAIAVVDVHVNMISVIIIIIIVVVGSIIYPLLSMVVFLYIIVVINTIERINIVDIDIIIILDWEIFVNHWYNLNCVCFFLKF